MRALPVILSARLVSPAFGCFPAGLAVSSGGDGTVTPSEWRLFDWDFLVERDSEIGVAALAPTGVQGLGMHDFRRGLLPPWGSASFLPVTSLPPADVAFCSDFGPTRLVDRRRLSIGVDSGAVGSSEEGTGADSEAAGTNWLGDDDGRILDVCFLVGVGLGALLRDRQPVLERRSDPPAEREPRWLWGVLLLMRGLGRLGLHSRWGVGDLRGVVAPKLGRPGLPSPLRTGPSGFSGGQIGWDASGADDGFEGVVLLAS